MTTTVAAPARSPRAVHQEPSTVDRWFDRVSLGSGLAVLVLLTLVAAFLLLRSQDALSETGIFRFLTRIEWRTDVSPPRIGVLSLLTGTVTVAFTAIVIAVPFGVLAALFITEARARLQHRAVPTARAPHRLRAHHRGEDPAQRLGGDDRPAEDGWAMPSPWPGASLAI